MLVEPPLDIDPMIRLGSWSVDRVSLPVVRQQFRRHTPRLEGMIPLQPLRGRDPPIVHTQRHQRRSLHTIDVRHRAGIPHFSQFEFGGRTIFVKIVRMYGSERRDVTPIGYIGRRYHTRNINDGIPCRGDLEQFGILSGAMGCQISSVRSTADSHAVRIDGGPQLVGDEIDGVHDVTYVEIARGSGEGFEGGFTESGRSAIIHVKDGVPAVTGEEGVGGRIGSGGGDVRSAVGDYNQGETLGR
mmetsp:Transcript_50568/g.152383  ORF Transcript_50568/g.152383 Transcript_50568/m.152383 type:complete len:243 (+) Transcript_50568:112-840(+)